ncbi:hypothetical protein ACQEVF_58075 [Nonomuraea polychroma]|uniref:hypothetical protein n=1 Tax=Nonomuraea polychroma TaxID=46176 RepID=UPI003D94CADD
MNDASAQRGVTTKGLANAVGVPVEWVDRELQAAAAAGKLPSGVMRPNRRIDLVRGQAWWAALIAGRAWKDSLEVETPPTAEPTRTTAAIQAAKAAVLTEFEAQVLELHDALMAPHEIADILGEPKAKRVRAILGRAGLCPHLYLHVRPIRDGICTLHRSGMTAASIAHMTGIDKVHVRAVLRAAPTTT